MTSLFQARVGAAFGFDTALNITRRAMNSKQTVIDHQDYGVLAEKSEFDGVPVTIYTKASWKTEKEKIKPAVFYIHGGCWQFELIGELSVDQQTYSVVLEEFCR